MRDIVAPKKFSARHSKLETRIYRFLSELLIKQALPPLQTEDGRLLNADSFITITKVDMSPDSKCVNIQFRHFDESKNTEALLYLQSITGFIKRSFSKAIKSKFTPEFRFSIDTNYIQQRRVEDLISKIRCF